MLENILKLEETINRIQEFSQWTNRKRRETQINLVDASPIIVIYPICFYLNRMGNADDDISSEEHFEI